MFDVARDAIATIGARVRRFGRHRTSLEEVFLSASTKIGRPAPYAMSNRDEQ
jgi:hypothetical protein